MNLTAKSYHILVVFIAIFTGCATVPTFFKEGADRRDHQKDWSECEMMAHQSGYENNRGVIGKKARYRYITECMEGRGWTKTN